MIHLFGRGISDFFYLEREVVFFYGAILYHVVSPELGLFFASSQHIYTVSHVLDLVQGLLLLKSMRSTCCLKIQLSKLTHRVMCGKCFERIFCLPSWICRV